MTLNNETIIAAMTFILFVLGTLLTVIGYYTKQFIEKVTKSLSELITAVKELQTITSERNAHNSEMHAQFRQRLDKHQEQLEAHGIKLEKHDTEISNIKNHEKSAGRGKV